MDSEPGTPSGGKSPGALQPVSSDRFNQQRDARREEDRQRDSITVSDKISQFNSLSMQSKQLERKTADAALKRAMLGREEAEAEMRRYRDEARALRKYCEEGKERERRVGERLETVMENYGRAKETHAHTQALWEKEIRRMRKETFKLNSQIVKLQEELKSARTALKSAEELLDLEKDRSKTREQEAFTARYSLVGVQEQLKQSQERIKMLEQERDAFKTLAKNHEDLAEIAAEGRIPLPPGGAQDNESASPIRTSRGSSCGLGGIKSSAASEAEIEELTMLWQWEKHRAERAMNHVEFLTTECELNICHCAKRYRQQVAVSSPRRIKISDPSDLVLLGRDSRRDSSVEQQVNSSLRKSKTERLRESQSREQRHSTIFVPTEGIFRTIPQPEADGLDNAGHGRVQSESRVEDAHVERPQFEVPIMEERSKTPATPADNLSNPPYYARTPSVEPPDFAMLAKQRTSLLSLLDAPHDQPSREVTVPTLPGPGLATIPSASYYPRSTSTDQNDNSALTQESRLLPANAITATTTTSNTTWPDDGQTTRPHTSATDYLYTSSTITTTVPLKDESADPGPSLSQRILAAQKTPRRTSEEDQPSWDITNPALTPTMTREQALAQIRERRARSGAVTPKRGITDGAGTERRDLSAPVGPGGVVQGSRGGEMVRKGAVTPGRRVRS